MKVILLTDVRKVGRKGTVVEVSPGYAANMLFPKGLATPATEERMRALAEAEAKKQAEAAAKDATLMRMVQSLHGAVLTIPIRATPQGGLFKSVDVKSVVKAIRMEKSLEIPDQVVHLEESIRTIGDHTVPLVYKTAKAEITVRIVREI